RVGGARADPEQGRGAGAGRLLVALGGRERRRLQADARGRPDARARGRLSGLLEETARAAPYARGDRPAPASEPLRRRRRGAGLALVGLQRRSYHADDRSTRAPARRAGAAALTS